MKLFKTYSEKEIIRLKDLISEVENLEEKIKKLSDQELKNKTQELKSSLSEKTLDEILPMAFAVVREAADRVLGMRHFRVQLIGGVILHQGRIAEMKTGEGKTLVATLAAYLNALEGRGVHIVTVNDYLAQRDSEWMGEIFRFLGLSVGVVLNDMDTEQRKNAYACDITYATNNELGFDYLRDNMAIDKSQLVQRELNYAIIDEIDSILIDEARTPLIISGSGSKSTSLYKFADMFAKSLTKGRVLNEDAAFNPIVREEIQEEGDFVVDEKAKSVTLTQAGIIKAEKYFKIENLSDPDNLELQHYVNNALKANYNMHIDKDYVIQNQEIIIVDEFTGRLMPGRRYSDGLHQAIEAKENVKVNRESKTLATITFQNFFNKYKKLCGMTGTALTEKDEFRQIYGLDVVEIETNRPMIRKDHADCVYKTEREKFKAVVCDIKNSYQKGQPVLIGTVTIENSEKLSEMLKREGIKHNVLNAKYHAKEAEIISQAGKKNSVTIATNMAGRGTDIKLEDGVQELGGLKVIGTERHESRRIDNQLRGRSGRQGDPGESRFYIALEDDLMRLFGSGKMLNIAESLGLKENEVIEDRMLSRVIANAQKKVEANHYSYRKNLLEYDQVMNEQRELIYTERKQILLEEDIKAKIFEIIKCVINRAVDLHTNGTYCEEWDINNLNEFFKPIFHRVILFLEHDKIKLIINNNLEEVNCEEKKLDQEKINKNTQKKIKKNKINKNAQKKLDQKESISREELKAKIFEGAIKIYELKEQEIGPEQMREIERVIILRIVDQHWMEHIDNMHRMRQSVALRSYAQRDPLVEYKFLSYDMFEEMTNNIQDQTVRVLFNIRVEKPVVKQETQQEIFTNSPQVENNKTSKRKQKKIGRNDLCPCGSNKKYKNCCGKIT